MKAHLKIQNEKIKKVSNANLFTQLLTIGTKSNLPSLKLGEQPNSAISKKSPGSDKKQDLMSKLKAKLHETAVSAIANRAGKTPSTSVKRANKMATLPVMHSGSTRNLDPRETVWTTYKKRNEDFKESLRHLKTSIEEPAVREEYLKHVKKREAPADNGSSRSSSSNSSDSSAKNAQS
mmetsp:Transcript_14096/g.21972  ORF Transcript_14096/g.21972 Transcript_14096/m.21972 type:complete len:178 (+) Transcript_14096:825-1358(+)